MTKKTETKQKTMTTKQRRRPRKTSGQEDRQEGGAGGGRGNYGAGTSPAGALAHGPCCHTKGGSIRVGLKDGGKRERFFFFLGCFSSLSV